MSTEHSEIFALLQEGRASSAPDGMAFGAPAERSISYSSLLQQLERVAAQLGGLGLGRGDRVAIVVPEGPCAATAFLAVAHVAVAAPLSPAYSAREFELYLSDLGARALIVAAGSESVAAAVARDKGIAVLELVATGEGAGLFELRCGNGLKPRRGGIISVPETCLVLHTSGTTSRPRVVPLTRAALCASARNIARTLRLSSNDRCLNVMPLFHMHGLVSAILAPLASGGSVVFTPGPRFPDFFEWLREFQPTWYSAAPTVHQAVLAASRAVRGAGSICKMRFVRSASAPLPPKVMEDLAGLFQAPVIEVLGMTESSQQITSNPLPPGLQKPGSVGIPAGPQVAISEGEVVIQGPTVMSGYENDPSANQEAFVEMPGSTGRWLRTGDLGYFDSDGYLFLTGRKKEVINRGGEKVSPHEVDAVLLAHPGVGEAATFPMPHPTLGEEVCAAVVPKDGVLLMEEELVRFVEKQLAYFRVPKRILIVVGIPRGPTGKIQRMTLFGKFKALLSSERVEPQDPLERRIAEIWKTLLGVEKVGVHDNFYSIGGDSLQAMVMIAKARDAGIEIDPVLSLRQPTISGLASIAREVSERLRAAAPAPTVRESLWRQLKREL